MHRPVLKGHFRIERRMKGSGDKRWVEHGEWLPMKAMFTSTITAECSIAEMQQKCQLWEYRIPRIACSNIWPSAHAIDRFRERIASLSTTDIADKLRACVERNLPPYVGVYRFASDGMVLVCDFDGGRCVVVTVMHTDQVRSK